MTSALEHLKVGSEPLMEQERHAAAVIRESLPGQKSRQTRRIAEAEFGLSYSLDELGKKARRSVPARFLKERRVTLTDVHSYTGNIPDAALIKLGIARASGLFRAYYVVDVEYVSPTSAASADPWLVGKIDESRFIVLAYWE